MSADLPAWAHEEYVETTWGDLVELKYGKGLKGYKGAVGEFPVYGTNGPVGFCDQPLCEFPSVIIGRKGAYRGVHYSDKPFFVIDTAYFVLPKFDINLKWAYYSLLTQDINGLDSGSAIPSTRREDFYALPVIVPPRFEQDKIVENLDCFNHKIILNRQTNQTLEHIAQAIFKSWFVDFEPTRAKIAAKQTGQDPERAAMAVISGKTLDEIDQLVAEHDVQGSTNVAGAGSAGATLEQLKTTAALFPDGLVDSELGEMPDGWEAKPLYETAEYINGNAFKTKDFSSDGQGLPIVKIAELKNGLSEGTKYTEGEFKEKYSIKNDDVLYSWSGSPETSLEVFKWFGGDGWLNQHIFKLNFTTDQQKYFTFYLLRHMKPILVATAQQKQTTGLGHVTVADMKRLLVAFPDDRLLGTFKEVVEPIYSQCSCLEKENIHLTNLRDTLLPKLLNGTEELGEKA